MNQPLINKHIAGFFGSRKQLDVCREGQQLGLPVTPLLEPGQVLDNEHTRARGTFRQLELEPDFPVTLPSGFLQLDETRVGPAGGPPALGQDNPEIYGRELGVSAEELAALREQGAI
jgi:crotonobetainyl-CoA:carnitine CoA-transferase CaiB-like acyl-CoA transferase